MREGRLDGEKGVRLLYILDGSRPAPSTAGCSPWCSSAELNRGTGGRRGRGGNLPDKRNTWLGKMDIPFVVR